MTPLMRLNLLLCPGDAQGEAQNIKAYCPSYH